MANRSGNRTWKRWIVVSLSACTSRAMTGTVLPLSPEILLSLADTKRTKPKAFERSDEG
ncbi:hypothetical protein [Nonomuraea sediminis]|uniref:hypothetical protein n=1 Tax=Nonomuraea sediminis TaxID=2835864 RepID=UPI001BDC9D95|nr:hypothetical protein [Nonomuraea sediminis]